MMHHHDAYHICSVFQIVKKEKHVHIDRQGYSNIPFLNFMTVGGGHMYGIKKNIITVQNPNQYIWEASQIYDSANL